MRFAISAWRAVSPFHQTLADWQEWVEKGRKASGLLPKDINLSFLPAMQRRRLSFAARLMFAASWPLVPEDIFCPVVFVSHDGEINRSLELWRDLIKGEELSPTSFALSVHNAIIGQWSLMRADMSEAIALSSKYNGLEVGVVEAVGLLEDGAEQVLVIVVDDPISAEYDVVCERAPFPLSLALVLTKGDKVNLSYCPEMRGNVGKQLKMPLTYHNSTLEWIVQQIAGVQERQQPDEYGMWKWQIK